MMVLRKLSPGGHEYLTGSVACGDRPLEPGESWSDYYLANGYPAGEWFGTGAGALDLSGQVTAAQMNALFGEGRHPNADAIEAELIASGASPDEALRATRLGRRFARYGGIDELRGQIIAAYQQHNQDHGQPVGAPIDAATRAQIRRQLQTKAFATDHEGNPPANEAELTKWLAEQQRQLKTAVAGFEVIFAPPKSVSVAWALANDDVRERIADIHRQAVKDSLAYLDSNAAFTRRGDLGETQVDIVGITAAVFEHWDSRTGDPHLHTHVPISAKVQRADDGKWTALDGRTILAATVTVSEFYNSRLRDLFREQGASWVQRPAEGIDVKRPIWELAGLPIELLAGFSGRARQVERERARQIVAFRHEHGREPSPKELIEIGKRAQYGTRAPKTTPRTLTEHRHQWRQFATERADPSTLDLLNTQLFTDTGEPIAELSAAEIARLADTTRFVVSDHHSHFNRWNLESEAHRQTAHLRVPPDARAELVASIADGILDASDTISLQAPSLVAEPAILRRRSGESVFSEHNAARYTTEQTLREEAELASWARRGGGHRLTAETVASAMRGYRLNPGQQKMVTEFARSGRRVQLALAPAGAGKTTAMRVLAKAWRAAGGRVYAFGPSARAAQELGEAIDARPHTLHSVTMALRLGRPQAFPFRRGDLLIVDEAAMAGTHTLHQVVRYGLRCGADVRLVGDDKQLGAVEAGGAVRWIALEAGAVRFREVVRFHDPDQAAASLLVRAGNPNGLGYYLNNGWVQGGSRETMRDAAQRAWRADLDAGRHTFLIVPTTEDVVWLNLQAREQRIRRGHVVDRRPVVLHDGTHASVGDWVVTRRNNRRLSLFSGRDFVKNGDTWAVTGVRRNGSLELTNLGHRARTVLPASYVTDHVELAYATTINRAEGMTAEHTAHTVVPQTMTRDQFYPGITRARGANYMYVETHHHVADDHQETPPEQTTEAVLIGVLRRTGLETPATEELRASLRSEESLATLVLRHNYAATLGVAERHETVLAMYAPVALDHDAEPALKRTLRHAEDLGWQAEQLVPSVVGQGDLTDADDPAAILQWRLRHQLDRHQPPPAVAEPDPADVARWRLLLSPAGAADPRWDMVWRYAAYGQLERLDVDSAIQRAAAALADRPTQDPMPDAHYVADIVLAEFDRQRGTGRGWQPALPWLTRPTPPLAGQDGLGDYLDQINEAIADRAAELRDHIASGPPDWTAGLGPRPIEPTAAARWDEIVGLAAAYRETYRITDDNPATPLGPEPDTHDLKGHAWRDILDRWTPPALDDTTAPETAVLVDAVEHTADTDGMLTALAALEPTGHRSEESLAVLATRYQQAVTAATNDDFARRAHAVLAERVPSALGAPAEPALLSILRDAQDLGWQLDQIIPDIDSLGGIEGARDPAAVLYRRVQHRLERAEPPGRDHVQRPGPLPWLTTADAGALQHQPELANHLDRLAERIADRSGVLRRQAIVTEPPWAASLGRRPAEPDAAARWDQLVGLAAAYRETYQVTTTHPTIPLGPQPSGHGTRANAWHELSQRWSESITANDDPIARNERRIDDLRNRVATIGGTTNDIRAHIDRDTTQPDPETDAYSDELDEGQLDHNHESRSGLDL